MQEICNGTTEPRLFGKTQPATPSSSAARAAKASAIHTLKEAANTHKRKMEKHARAMPYNTL
jgi:hypothetical protein